jgi:hypothetical protein
MQQQFDSSEKDLFESLPVYATPVRALDARAGHVCGSAAQEVIGLRVRAARDRPSDNRL